MHRRMGCAGRDQSEKRLILIHAFLDEAHGLVEKNIRAKAFRCDHHTIVQVAVIKIGVIPQIRGKAERAALKAIDLLKPLIFRTVGIIVTEMPLAEEPRSAARVGENFGDRNFLCPQNRP